MNYSSGARCHVDRVARGHAATCRPGGAALSNGGFDALFPLNGNADGSFRYHLSALSVFSVPLLAA